MSFNFNYTKSKKIERIFYLLLTVSVKVTTSEKAWITLISSRFIMDDYYFTWLSWVANSKPSNRYTNSQVTIHQQKEPANPCQIPTETSVSSTRQDEIKKSINTNNTMLMQHKMMINDSNGLGFSRVCSPYTLSPHLLGRECSQRNPRTKGTGHQKRGCCKYLWTSAGFLDRSIHLGFARDTTLVPDWTRCIALACT